MPSLKTVPVRKYNKQVKLVARLYEELEVAKNTVAKLTERSKIQRSRHSLRLKTLKTKLEKDAIEQLEACKRELNQRIQDISKIQDSTKRENERLKLALQNTPRVQGNLETIDEHVHKGLPLRFVRG